VRVQSKRMVTGRTDQGEMDGSTGHHPTILTPPDALARWRYRSRWSTGMGGHPGQSQRSAFRSDSVFFDQACWLLAAGGVGRQPGAIAAVHVARVYSELVQERSGRVAPLSDLAIDDERALHVADSLA